MEGKKKRKSERKKGKWWRVKKNFRERRKKGILLGRMEWNRKKLK